jgi:HD superfamily phosphohydrolase
MENYFEKYDWQTILNEHPQTEKSFNIEEYYKILCPEFPNFLKKYIELPIMQRLSGIGLLCGTDWTSLYKNRFFYSRLDHSVGVALIIWNFTKDKTQTIAGLLHDVSTTVFSHVSDFRKGDALTQTSTEEPTTKMILSDSALCKLMESDGIEPKNVVDYHIYPIADNEIPALSADRLEYMYPSGLALDGSWTFEEIAKTYNDLIILKNEENKDELGFKTIEMAELYCKKFCMIGHILQLNENKLCLQLLSQIMSKAVELNVLQEEDFMTLSESKIIEKIESFISKKTFSLEEQKFATMYNTFRKMTKVEHTNQKLPEDEYFCVSLKVKQRYINPLVKVGTNSQQAKRLSEVSDFANKLIKDFLEYEDTKFGCVKLIPSTETDL